MNRPSHIGNGLWIVALFLCLASPPTTRVASATDSQNDSADAVAANLLKAAKTGDAAAQYNYWKLAVESAQADTDKDAERVRSLERGMTLEQMRHAMDGWDTTPEADLVKLAGTGDRLAQIRLARLGEEQAVARATNSFVWLEKSARQGFPHAEYELAIYALGESGWQVYPLDREQGVTCLTRAAEHGLAAAQSELGELLLAGQKVPPDVAQAVAWLQKAADQGRPYAQFLLAEQYANGNGEPRGENDTPVALLRKSAQSGNNLALQALGDRYRTGLGVPLDYIQAIRYYLAARDADYKLSTKGYTYVDSRADEIFNTRIPHPYANSPVRDVAPRKEWDPSLADFGLVVNTYWAATTGRQSGAARQIGDWYSAGRFMPKDPVEAWKWYALAASRGDQVAVQQAAAIKAGLTPDQLKKLETMKP